MSAVDPRTNHKTLRTAERALTILEILNVSEDLTTSEIARASRLSRATAYRILCSLINTGYVTRDAGAKTYHLTNRVLSLSVGYTLKEALIDLASPIIEQASRTFIWPLLMARPNGTDMEVLVSTDYDNPFAIRRSKSGQRRHISRTASGRSFMASSPASIRSQYLKLMRAGGLDDEELEAFKADVRLATKQGYASFQEDGELENSVSIPLIAQSGVVATLSARFVLTAVPYSAVEAEILPVLRTVAGQITDQLRQSE